jgi:hypothetical protein
MTILASCHSSLLSAFLIQEIVQSIESLCKCAHHKWKMGSDPIVEFGIIKAMIEKQLSSYVTFIIYVMANSTNFTYCRKLKTNIQDVVMRHHILIKGFKSKGGTIYAVTFIFVMSLKCHVGNQGHSHWTTHPLSYFAHPP